MRPADASTKNSNPIKTDRSSFTPLREKTPKAVKEMFQKFALPSQGSAISKTEDNNRTLDNPRSATDHKQDRSTRKSSAIRNSKPKASRDRYGGFEPMQPVAEQYKAPSRIHEEVVNNLRQEKDTISRAYSNEKGTRMRLQEDIEEKDHRVTI